MNDELKAALWSALFVFIAVFVPAVTGFLQSVTEWANGNADFPSLSVLASAAVAGLAAAFTGIVNFVVRKLQVATGKGQVPTYVPAASKQK